MDPPQARLRKIKKKQSRRFRCRLRAIFGHFGVPCRAKEHQKPWENARRMPSRLQCDCEQTLRMKSGSKRSRVTRGQMPASARRQTPTCGGLLHSAQWLTAREPASRVEHECYSTLAGMNDSKCWLRGLQCLIRPYCHQRLAHIVSEYMGSRPAHGVTAPSCVHSS